MDVLFCYMGRYNYDIIVTQRQHDKFQLYMRHMYMLYHVLYMLTTDAGRLNTPEKVLKSEVMIDDLSS